jgi:hypothetical protein
MSIPRKKEKETSKFTLKNHLKSLKKKEEEVSKRMKPTPKEIPRRLTKIRF